MKTVLRAIAWSTAIELFLFLGSFLCAVDCGTLTLLQLAVGYVVAYCHAPAVFLLRGVSSWPDRFSAGGSAAVLWAVQWFIWFACLSVAFAVVGASRRTKADSGGGAAQPGASPDAGSAGASRAPVS